MQKLTRTLCVSLTRFSRFFAAFSSALCLATSGAGCPGAWLCGHVCLKWCGLREAYIWKEHAQTLHETLLRPRRRVEIPFQPCPCPWWVCSVVLGHS
jgi:hypothetical protein